MKFYTIIAVVACANAIQLKYDEGMTGPNMGTA